MFSLSDDTLTLAGTTLSLSDDTLTLAGTMLSLSDDTLTLAETMFTCYSLGDADIFTRPLNCKGPVRARPRLHGSVVACEASRDYLHPMCLRSEGALLSGSRCSLPPSWDCLLFVCVTATRLCSIRFLSEIQYLSSDWSAVQ